MRTMTSSGKGKTMSEKRYLVAENGKVLARGMSLEDALLFIEAYCNKYYKMPIDLRLQDEDTENEE